MLILLTLVLLDCRPSYAAPLILLAQNRQEHRDRSQSATDRRVAERTQSDTEFLARELASVRLALGDMVTSEDLDDRLQRLTDAVERLSQQLGATAPLDRFRTGSSAARRETESTSCRVTVAESSGFVSGAK